MYSPEFRHQSIMLGELRTAAHGLPQKTLWELASMGEEGSVYDVSDDELVYQWEQALKKKHERHPLPVDRQQALFYLPQMWQKHQKWRLGQLLAGALSSLDLQIVTPTDADLVTGMRSHLRMTKA